jgi:hypothetical protein
VKRKIVQVTAAGVEEKQSTQCECFLFALCDDGTLWMTDNRIVFGRPGEPYWTRLQDVPQDDEDAS